MAQPMGPLGGAPQPGRRLQGEHLQAPQGDSELILDLMVEILRTRSMGRLTSRSLGVGVQ